MDRKQVNEILPILVAFAEGKAIESRCIKGDKSLWYDDEDPSFDNDFEYRIKPESKYRPFKGAEECWQGMKNHQPFGWVKWNDVQYNIYVVSSTSVCLINGSCENMDFAYAYQKLTFADGTPFGVKVEEQL
jgi:hypothetical protein